VRLRAAAAVAGLVAASILGVSGTAAAAPVTPVTADDCKRQPGAAAPTSTWAQDRLALQQAQTVTQGRDVRSGRPIRVAVLDSGLDRTHPQLRHLDADPLRDAIPNDPGRKFSDCAQHGTWVTAVLAAQRNSTTRFFGIAPQVRIVPIKLTNGEKVASADVARAINLAIDAHAQIANLSLGLSVDVPAVRSAVARAKRARMLIVAASGNDGAQGNSLPQYPAAYSTQYDNVIAVSATEKGDAVAKTAGSGRFVDLAAPGGDVQTIGVNGGYTLQSGTSFATPFVSGAAALVLAANPGMSPAQLRTRLELTADPPAETVPSPKLGYGIVNPYLAMTTVAADTPPTSAASAAPSPLTLGAPPAAPDRHLQDVALGAGFGLLGLAALVITGAAVLRGGRATGRRRSR
jgi:membrane-anchored mycosin MYCP